ncbi:MAG: TetR/AcrR family transcriptional regulator [Deltaproteobacteria bacterium]|nr:TetR/AcrR family transcriptional regulator [Deltaproteobacteria bacterium]MBW2254129.1 TetR/AcrR family transcriptional regulator [Deltaproteobacteria bacterium]
MPSAPRRTQAERRASSMRRLEEAAIQALVDLGVQGATTTEICKRAGLSQGALFQHYPSKSTLLVAAVKRLYGRLAEDLLTHLSDLPDPERVRGAVAMLWRAFANAEAVATLELYAASRTDAALRAELSPMLEAHYAELVRAASQVLPPAVFSNPDYPSILAITMAAMQGAATGAVVEGREPPGLDHHLDFVARLLEGG